MAQLLAQLQKDTNITYLSAQKIQRCFNLCSGEDILTFFPFLGLLLRITENKKRNKN